MQDRKWQIIPSKHGLAANVCQHDNASHEWIFFPPFFCRAVSYIKNLHMGAVVCQLKRLRQFTKKGEKNPRGKTGGPLTAVLLVAVVRAVVVVVTSPQGRDAASVLALKLPGFTF